MKPIKTFIFEKTVTIDRPRQEVFEFFSKAENLEHITPAWLKFKILTPTPVEIYQGRLIDYRLRLYGLPFRWKTEITVWEPPLRFVDSQLKGPYVSWVHEHRFEEKGEQTIMTDRVEYAVPGGPVAPLINKLFVAANVQKIFEYRKKVIQEHFLAHPELG